MPTLITQADRYYIDKERLYITRYEEISDTERLYFAPREKPDDLTDTFLAVGTNISMGGGVMFMPLGGGIYYTDEGYDLCRYDMSTKKSEHITGFDEEKNIYYYTVLELNNRKLSETLCKRF